MTALGALGALAITFTTTVGTTAASPQSGQSPTAQEFNFGRGSAVAQTIKIDPRVSQLSLGISGGVSLAGHQNHTGSAESRGVDLGIIGLLLAAPGCDGGDPTLPAKDQPHPSSAQTGQPGAAPPGKTEQDDKVPVITKHVEAGDATANAVTSITKIGVPNLLEIGSTTSSATSRVIDGVREAVATVDISYLRLAGVLELSGLHWEAIHHGGGDSMVTGAFSIGGGFSLNSLGLKIPLPLDSGKLFEAISALTKALGLGLEIQAPRVHQEGPVMFVDPLVIGVIPSATRDGLARPAMEAVQPLYFALNTKLTEMDCSYASVATVEDVAIGSVTGAGSFGVQIGGVSATTAEIKQFSFGSGFGSAVGGGLGSGNVGTGGGGSTSSTSGAAPRAAAPAPAPAASPAPTQAAAPAPAPATTPVKAVGKRGGALAGVGLAGLALLALVAEGDRRKMRNAQRMIPMEV